MNGSSLALYKYKFTQAVLSFQQKSIYSSLAQNIHLLNGVVRGMPCARDWMSSDYGPGTNTFGPNEYAVWAQ